MKIKLASWNVDTNLAKTEEGYARESHPEWRVANRLPAICQKLTEIDVDLLNLQELRKTTIKDDEIIDSITPLQNHLESIGYQVLVKPYNQTDKAWQFITAFKQDKFELIGSKLRYFTKTPDQPTIRPNIEGQDLETIKSITATIKDHNYGELFERGAFIIHLKHLATDQELLDINIHLGMTLTHRLKASELLYEFVQQELATHSSAKLIVAGDFNSFPDWQGPEQINLLTNPTFGGSKLLTEVSNTLCLPNGQPMNSTFIFFPFDFGSQEAKLKEEIAELSKLEVRECKAVLNKIFSHELCKALGGQLDHIFVHDLHKLGEVIIDVTPQYEPYPEDYTEEAIKEYIMSHPEGPAFASDHQPLVANLIGAEEYR